MIKINPLEQSTSMIGYSTVSVAANAVDETTIRPAALADAPQISKLVNRGEREGQLLPRSLDSIRASIGDWIVAESRRRIIGVGSLIEMGPGLVEVRSLVVAPAHRKNGIGAKIVDALVDEARARGIQTVFALTRAVPFFEKLAFSATEKENFPEKVWRDCLICPVRHACDEVAVVKLVSRQQAS
jgi:amino-acid N-acetyltransferase